MALSVRSPLTFFLWVFALSIPFWLLAAMTHLELLPRLPISALMSFCPALAALILVYKQNKTVGMTDLLKRSFDLNRIRAKIWYAPIVLLMPCVVFLAYGLLRWLDLPLPIPQFPVLAAPFLFLAFLITALGEELGWSGYILDPMQARWNALQSSLLLGCVWAAWHIVPYLQAQRSVAWIGWYCLFTVATRVLMVWIYNNTGKSVFGVALFHAMVNISWILFPNFGSHYDPRITGLIVACLATIVTVLWGQQTLARYRT